MAKYHITKVGSKTMSKNDMECINLLTVVTLPFVIFKLLGWITWWLFTPIVLTTISFIVIIIVLNIVRK